MPVRGAKDIKGAHDIEGAQDLKGVHTIKTVDDIKGAEDIKGARDIEGVSDHKGLFLVQESLKEAGKTLRHNLQSAQANLQTGANQVRESVGKRSQKLSEGLKQVGNLPHNLEETLIRTAVEIGIKVITKNTKRRIRKAAKTRLKKTQAKVTSLPHAVGKTWQTGVSTAHQVLGKHAPQISNGLKKTPGKIISLPSSIGKGLHAGMGAITHQSGKPVKKEPT